MSYKDYNKLSDEETLKMYPFKFEDYYIEFNENETARRHFFDGDNLLITNKDEDGLNGYKMALKHDLFYEGATIFRGINSTELVLTDDNYK